jgi:two-component SAPR family response regulator
MVSAWVKNKDKIFATNYKRTRNSVCNETTNESICDEIQQIASGLTLEELKTRTNFI